MFATNVAYLTAMFCKKKKVIEINFFFSLYLLTKKYSSHKITF